MARTCSGCGQAVVRIYDQDVVRIWPACGNGVAMAWLECGQDVAMVCQDVARMWPGYSLNVLIISSEYGQNVARMLPGWGQDMARI